MKSPSKSCELDPLSSSMMKQNIDIFVPYITKLVNESLSSGCFSDSLNVSYIRPLIKKPNLDKEIVKNYRPVANLKYLDKVIERVDSSRISDHIHTVQPFSCPEGPRRARPATCAPARYTRGKLARLSIKRGCLSRRGIPRSVGKQLYETNER